MNARSHFIAVSSCWVRRGRAAGVRSIARRRGESVFLWSASASAAFCFSVCCHLEGGRPDGSADTAVWYRRGGHGEPPLYPFGDGGVRRHSRLVTALPSWRVPPLGPLGDGATF